MNKIIAMVGMSGSGKSEATNYMLEKGYEKVYFGGITYEKMKEENIPYTPENDKKMRMRLREDFGMAAYAILSLPKIDFLIKSGKKVYIDDLYSWQEYELLKEKYGDNIILICVIVDKNIRYERLKLRKERPYTKQEAINRDLNELENLSKGGPIAYADYYIYNNGSLKQYNDRLKEIVEEVEKNEI